MAFLTKKESALIISINASTTLTERQRSEAIEKVKYNARLRSDGHRKPVKIFLSVISTLKNNAIAAELLKC